MQDTPATDSANLLQRGLNAFREHFHADPTHAARSPGRVNLIGEHTDYNNGLVLPMTIQRETILVAALNHSQRCRIVALNLEGEMATFMNDDSLAPGKTSWANYIKGVVHQFRINGQRIPSFDAVVVSDLPIGAGLASSAALEVATASLLELLLGIRLGPERKATWCMQSEQQFVGLPCGIMDMFIASLGRRDHAMLIDCFTKYVTPIPLDPQAIRIVIADSGVRHALTDGSYADRKNECEQAVQVLKEAYMDVLSLREANLTMLESQKHRMPDTIFRRARHVVTENARVDDTARALKAKEWETAGFLMSESHRSLRMDFEVSCPELDALVTAAMRVPGVFGARLTGGGFGGCIVCLVAAGAEENLLQVLRSHGAADAFVARPTDGAGAASMVGAAG